MDYRKELSQANIDKNKYELEKLINTIKADVSYLDKWFDMFIEKFSDRMDVEDRSSPVWKKYYERFDEYSDLQRQLMTAEYYIQNVGK